MQGVKYLHFSIFSFLFQYSFHTSCKQIKHLYSRASNGVYVIKPLPGSIPMVVYCEMTIAGGGFTFLPRSLTTRSDAQKVINALFTERYNVLLKLQHRGQHKESYTQITPYWGYHFGVRVNSYTGYTRPMNSHMHDYILFGVIPRSAAAKKSYQGFTSNYRRVKFWNCDGNPNSLFAFLPNHYHQVPSTYHFSNLVYERQGVAVDWRKTARPIQHPVRTMPNEFFFLTELHFGGCGCYTSSDRWKDGYQATAIGLR